MSLIKFNSDSKHYYKCSECSYSGTKATITGIESHPNSLEGGFGVFEYSDIECKNPHLVEDLSRFSLVWEQGEDTLVFSSDKRTYRTYFIYNEDGFITSEVTGTRVIEGNALLADSGIGREHEEYKHIELFDKDGFYLYKAVEDKVVETTAEDKQTWKEEQTAAQLLSAKEAKIAEISTRCAKAVTDGVIVNDVHYSYQLTDQNNLSNAMNLAVQTGLDVPYHADSENCRLYTREELTAIYIAAELNVTGQVTYNNQMKRYISTLTTIEEVNAVQYGDKLKGEYLETYNAMMKQAEEVIKKLVNV